MSECVVLNLFSNIMSTQFKCSLLYLRFFNSYGQYLTLIFFLIQSFVQQSIAFSFSAFQLYHTEDLTRKLHPMGLFRLRSVGRHEGCRVMESCATNTSSNSVASLATSINKRGSKTPPGEIGKKFSKKKKTSLRKKN